MQILSYTACRQWTTYPLELMTFRATLDSPHSGSVCLWHYCMRTFQLYQCISINCIFLVLRSVDLTIVSKQALLHTSSVTHTNRSGLTGLTCSTSDLSLSDTLMLWMMRSYIPSRSCSTGIVVVLMTACVCWSGVVKHLV